MNKTVIITGANGNLGTAVINHFLAKNYKVVGTVTSQEAKEQFQTNSSLAIAVVDLTDEEVTKSFVQDAIRQHGKIDAALLLVGGFATGSISETSSADIRKQIALNFDTAFHVARPLFQHMTANNDGRIVFVAARPAILAEAGKDMVAYGLSKSLLLTLAGYLNEEARGKNVTTTVIVPSTLDTPLNRKNMPEADPDNWVKPEALAEILEFVVSGKSDPLRETVLKVYNNA